MGLGTDSGAEGEGVTGSAGGCTCINPGRKKLAGDTLGEADRPLHPVQTNAKAITQTAPASFSSNFTQPTL